MKFATRFAPSPTGPLHLGHAYSALLAHDTARTVGGRFLLRIEDIDTTRSRPEWEDRIYEDLTWLGIEWDDTPMRQSDRLSAYLAALHSLWDRGLLYPCHCTRRDIVAASSAPQEGSEPTHGPDGLIYQGTCRVAALRTGPMPENTTLRLDMQAALWQLPTDTSFGFDETGPVATDPPSRLGFTAQDMIATVGDIVLSRKDFIGSYHLSVVLDDAVQGISHVIRGKDLFEATKIHVILQHLLSLETPIYTHHKLIRDETGKRLAKRDDARAIAKYRAEGATPRDIRRMVGL
ncbi:Glutamate--tRNA ligase [Thalassovita gelatinovora]|uniref:Glutamate--tRNA ligase n=1 Tax=Thalassovita gelatinovora TaxID=53501 RepID=A0A0P1F4B0_THAGE|nr:tRNA glutamyl-Q(34) synthetase GluQRS [Thalassovita gelatinovora]QIZ79281.1 tRNA glutamyl-Q(34) synthetase GluQRS [Thalassovita gelatinovora]CUH62496.1 Glutamate--tRNA ligase [Thalassovita gelatinovora]SEQ05466.1 glutamyl-Q tRNA(Asp) synthetase [Thalassovita gelatinovora]